MPRKPTWPTGSTESRSLKTTTPGILRGTRPGHGYGSCAKTLLVQCRFFISRWEQSATCRYCACAAYLLLQYQFLSSRWEQRASRRRDSSSPAVPLFGQQVSPDTGPAPVPTQPSPPMRGSRTAATASKTVCSKREAAETRQNTARKRQEMAPRFTDAEERTAVPNYPRAAPGLESEWQRETTFPGVPRKATWPTGSPEPNDHNSRIWWWRRKKEESWCGAVRQEERRTDEVARERQPGQRESPVTGAAVT
ncbi:uncharacterized protein LOC118175589 [Oxyura jamaicensis]|uniref:uncharacterized protein LOC118175589 n=1 Tax=Oxyura jamaicensis TaxID=8884 RepID=UPI0015A68D3A|nr:uncharacterized protein LOC118175589 [Oxyura jamaicensis]